MTRLTKRASSCSVIFFFMVACAFRQSCFAIRLALSSHFDTHTHTHTHTHARTHAHTHTHGGRRLRFVFLPVSWMYVPSTVVSDDWRYSCVNETGSNTDLCSLCVSIVTCSSLGIDHCEQSRAKCRAHWIDVNC